jgi:ribonuclease BN (tRNA processing enzyme)
MESKDDGQDASVSRRDFLTSAGAGVVGAGVAAGGLLPNQAAAQAAGDQVMPKNPYGGRPGGGISLPEYYKPWPAITNRNMFLPGTEILPKNEMRVTFLGSSPWPPSRTQKGTCILVELGNGTSQPRRFFFDLGNGSIGHAIAMQVPAALINDIFISHLHADHFADLPYMYPFRAFSGGFTPLRVYGPSGRTPELGIKHMVKHMREMNRWHEENFNTCPVGDGMEIEVTEFDWKDRNGICYDKDGVKVRHWPRSHAKDGASAYRLDWEEAGLSFVWTGDGRPDELSALYGKGADVFVSEGTIDTPTLSALKVGSPAELWEFVIDIYHTMYYAAGYLPTGPTPHRRHLPLRVVWRSACRRVHCPNSCSLARPVPLWQGPQGHQRHEGRHLVARRRDFRRRGAGIHGSAVVCETRREASRDNHASDPNHAARGSTGTIRA